MKKKKLLSYILSFTLIFASFTPVMAADRAEVSDFADMPNDWSTTALVNAVENGLITGFNENGKVYIKAGNPLKRAEMAAIINKAFNTSIMASMSDVSDVKSSDWFYDHMAKAVQMESFAKASKMRPNDNITREETFTVLAKVFKIPEASNYSLLNNYRDADKVSDYAKGRIEALLQEGYISGTGNILNPKKNITRAEFATVMNNIAKKYIDTAGTVTSVPSGNVIINTSDVILRGVTVTGDLIIADGVGNGHVTLDSVDVTGRVVVRGGGASSIEITGTSGINDILVDNINYQVRIYAANGTRISSMNLMRQAIVDGSFSNVSVIGEDADISVRGNVSNMMVAATSKVTIEKNATVRALTIERDAARTVIQGLGTLERATVYGNNSQINTNNTRITVGSGVNGVSTGNWSLDAGDTVTSDPDAASQTAPDESGDSVKSVSLNMTATEFLAGSTNTATRKELKATISPSNAANKQVKWAISGSNADRFELYDSKTGGRVITEGENTNTLTVYIAPSSSRALTIGQTASVKVTTADGSKSETCKITVTDTQTATPKVSSATVSKTSSTQKEVSFTLTNNPKLSGTWKVYANSSSSTLASNMSASNSGATLYLNHKTDIPADTYYVTVTEADKTESERLALTVSPYGTYTISGTITGSDASGGLKATLQLKNSSGNNVGSSVTAASNGTYSITGVAAANGYTIAVTYSGYANGTISSFNVTNKDVTGKNLVLSRGYTVSGKITGSDAPNGLAASLQLKNSSGNVGGAVTAASTGTYSITGVVAGTYTIEVTCSGYSAGTITSFTVSNQNVTGKDLKLNATTVATYTINGKITGDDAPNGLAAKLQLKSGTNNVGNFVTADSNGNYEITGVLPGTYTIDVSMTNYKQGTIPVVVVKNNLTGQDCELTKVTYTVTVDVVDTSGAAISGATLTVTSGTGTVSGYSITGVPAGSTCTIEARKTGYITNSVTLPQVSGDTPTTIVLDTDPSQP